MGLVGGGGGHIMFDVDRGMPELSVASTWQPLLFPTTVKPVLSMQPGDMSKVHAYGRFMLRTGEL